MSERYFPGHIDRQLVHELSVYGYIREIQSNHRSLIIPEDITNICLDYYIIRDFFAVKGDKILLNGPRSIAVGSTRYKRARAVYGNEIIDPSDPSVQCYCWTLKVWNIDSSGFQIGLCDIDNMNANAAGTAPLLTYSFRKFLGPPNIMYVYEQVHDQWDWIHIFISKFVKRNWGDGVNE